MLEDVLLFETFSRSQILAVTFEQNVRLGLQNEIVVIKVKDCSWPTAQQEKAAIFG